MTNWRELGEVPDSDDEGFDDYSSDPDPQPEFTELQFQPVDDPDDLPESTPPADPPEEAQVEDPDIWNVPDSSPIRPPSTLLPKKPRPRPLPAPAPAPASVPNVSKPLPAAVCSLPGGKVAAEAEPASSIENPPRDSQTLPRNVPSALSPLSSPLSSPPSDREPSPSPPARSSPAPSPRALSPPPPSILPASRPTLPAPRPLVPEEPQGDDNEDVEVPRQTGTRLERSLRPRKPIQQHPYLLETAQYARLMKSHGVKPIRIALEAELAIKRAQQEDSEGEDYEADESQERPQETEDSGPALLNDRDDEQDELAPSPSPPRTSSAGNPFRRSSQPDENDQTPLTSFSDDDLPSLQQLMHDPSKLRMRRLKRKGSQLLSSRRKRPQIPSSSQASSPPRRLLPPPTIWDLSSSPVASAAEHQVLSEILGTTSPIGGRQKSTPGGPSSALPTSRRFPERPPNTTPILVEDEETGSDSDSASSTSSTASESDIRENSKRIKGVLPASWLRLDKQNKSTVSRNARKSPEPAPNILPKRGVAVPTQSAANRVNSTQFLFDEADDSGDEPVRVTPRERVRSPKTPAIVIHEDDDDGASVVEEDWVDPMLAGRRKRASSPSVAQKAKRRKGDHLVDRLGKRRQPRITEVLGRSTSKSGTTNAKRRDTKTRRGGSRSSYPRSPPVPGTPPLLSILDVVEPEAPRFLKVAARAVKSKPSLGRTNPSKKIIRLANRKDNVDALSSLRDWKYGKTRQKATLATPRQRESSKARQPLQRVSSNPRPIPPKSKGRPRSAFPQKLAKQGDLNGFVTVEQTDPEKITATPPVIPGANRKASRDSRPAFYPAQLETEDIRLDLSHLSHHTRSMDAFHRKFNVPPSTGRLSDRLLLDIYSTPQPRNGQGAPSPVSERAVSKKTRERTNAKPRPRKALRPHPVDVEAPQFKHADDPLPAPTVFVVEAEESRQKLPDKITGLGPYGTHYTHHFEIFPLDRGVFFHESTIIGRGLVRKAVDTELSAKARGPRLTVSFGLDGQTLRWGTWDDKTSSEFGIVVDWITEKISPEAAVVENGNRQAVEASDFILRYILDSVRLPDGDAETSFLVRCLDVFSGLLDRFQSVEWEHTPIGLKRVQLDVGINFALAVMALRSLSQSSQNLVTQILKVEALLKRWASAVIRGLLSCGLEELQSLYDDLQRLTFRERGIRPDQRLANWWAVMIRILENAKIPKSSFWDITHSIMIIPGIASSSDAQVFEKLWKDMFTILPLGEVDNDGVVIPGSRRTKPLDGWMLPQQLMKRVFHLYKSKVHQPPSFNEYCRALVARCHYLVQQWGWKMTSAAIGTIFDFFGSRELTNLRNEEVHQSAGFLEELRAHPSLSVEPQDRCFHIFLKLVALSIRHLKHLQRQNDIRNVIARVMPAHGRQYLRENAIDQRDLAGLRNHHDLLCTLYWEAPPDLRPGLHLIENLVIPAKAHKEAVLINLRAWSQLARFVISGSDGAAEFRPFLIWGNSVFNQVLEQYVSAASDIEQQFRALSSEMQGITTAVRDQMVAKNKASALDILHFSVVSSLEVLRRAATFEATVSALNVNQLQKVFTSLDLDAPGFNWGVIRAALETVGHFFTQLDKVSEEQYSSGASDNIDPQHIEDAALLFHEKVAKDFFWMTRKIMGLPKQAKQGGQAICVNKAVSLGARIAARFVKDGLTSLPSFFSPGKYCLFSSFPKDMTTAERKYLPLFIALLVENNVFDFRSLDSSLLSIWLLCITKPSRFFAQENYLGGVLKTHGIDFMQRAVVLSDISTDYNSNVDLFSCAMQYMRRKLRESGPGQSVKELRSEYDKTLQLVMQRMKADLWLLRPNVEEHALYVDFVRQIISLIKSYGVNICGVDPFFTRPSPEYSPPVQDPELHMATILSYGIRLGEDDERAVPQLFYYLLNNFKVALGNNKLDQERRTMTLAMRRDANILSYVVEIMVPSMILALQQVSEAWMLLELYADALIDVLTRRVVPKELSGRDIGYAVGLLRGAVGWFAALRDEPLSLRQVYVMGILAGLVEALQPSFWAYLYAEPEGWGEEVGKEVEAVRKALEGAHDEVGAVLGLPEGELTLDAVQNEGLHGWLPETWRETEDLRVRDFATAIVTDVQKTWAVTEERVMVQMAAGRLASLSGTQPGQGTRYGPWKLRELLERFRALAGRWKLGRAEHQSEQSESGTRQRARPRRPVVLDELVF